MARHVCTETARNLWAEETTLEAVNKLREASTAGSLAQLIKHERRALRTDHDLTVRLGWVPGHGNRAGPRVAADASSRSLPLPPPTHENALNARRLNDVNCYRVRNLKTANPSLETFLAVLKSSFTN